MSTKLSVITSTSDEQLASMTDKEIEDQVIILLEDNRRLRHEIKNKRQSYELAMGVNHRLTTKIKELEEAKKLNDLCTEVFINRNPKRKVA